MMEGGPTEPRMRARRHAEHERHEQVRTRVRCDMRGAVRKMKRGPRRGGEANTPRSVRLICVA